MYTYIYAVYMQMVYTVYIHEDQYIDIRYKYRDKLKFIHTHTHLNVQYINAIQKHFTLS